MPGHRVLAEIELLPVAEGGLHAPLEDGNRSLIFVFDGDNARFGGVIENIDGAAQPGGRFKAEIWFWVDLASIHAVAGASFHLWYGRTVGRGDVLEVVPQW